MSTNQRSRAWVEVTPSALRENLRRVRRAVGRDTRLIPMVKANAYGLGLAPCVSALEQEDPWGYGVAALEEGIQLRSLGIGKPVLVMSPVSPGSYLPAIRAGLTVSVGDLEAVVRVREAAREANTAGRFHVEIDTGMGRAGFDWQGAQEWGQALAALLDSSVQWEGCFTHFHSADSADEEPTRIQWARFLGAVEALPHKPDGLLLHACNSPGAFRRPDFAADGVRPGIFLYGGVAGHGIQDPVPVASLRARVVFLREAAEGATTGYGATYGASRAERWATVSLGYGDGLPRLLGNRGQALVRGRRVPIIGRISMDVTVLDVTEVAEVEVGDVATFIGRDGSQEITVEEVADLARTINYEILTGLTQRLPRIWTDDVGYE